MNWDAQVEIQVQEIARVLKHLPGEHDQDTHGNGNGGTDDSHIWDGAPFTDRFGRTFEVTEEFPAAKNPGRSLFHGTRSSNNVDAIMEEGLTAPNTMLPAQWFVLTSSPEQAGSYAVGPEDEIPAVLEYRIPESEFHGRVSQHDLLWDGETHGAYLEGDEEAMAYAIMKPLDKKYLARIYKPRQP